jgi:sugar lactone lactonase YvrE
MVRRWLATGSSFAWLLAAAACGSDAGETPSGKPCDPGDPGVVCAVAGTTNMGFNKDGLAPDKTDMYLVSEVRRGPDGLIYMMDFNNHRLRRINADGVVETIAGDGFHAFAMTGVAATDSGLENPIDFDWLPDGRIALVSYHDPRVLVIDDDGILHALAGTGELGATGSEGDGGAALEAQFIQMDGMLAAPDGSIYVSDSIANRVRVVKDGIVTTVAGSGDAASDGTGNSGYSGDGGPAVEAQLHWPTALALGPDGTLYFADSLNQVIRHVRADGTIETVAGTGDKGYAGDGGPATAAQLAEPNGLAIDADGTMYISDRSNFVLRRVDPDGTIDTIAGIGLEGFDGNGGAALDAEFGYTARVQLDGDQLLLADQSNSCVRRVILP